MRWEIVFNEAVDFVARFPLRRIYDKMAPLVLMMCITNKTTCAVSWIEELAKTELIWICYRLAGASRRS